MNKKILIVEDEAAIRNILKEALAFAGYQVALAADGPEGINVFHSQVFDLVLLDILLPKLDGYTVCETIRKESQVPVILLTALDSEDDQIRGFNKLADDYITKPFSVKLLLKRVEALLRRASFSAAGDLKSAAPGPSGRKEGYISYRELVLSEAERQVWVSGEKAAFTHLEFELLLLFLKNPGRVFTRDELLNLVWGYDFAGDEKGVNFHIMNLRRKLKADYIETVRGVGYKIARED